MPKESKKTKALKTELANTKAKLRMEKKRQDIYKEGYEAGRRDSKS